MATGLAPKTAVVFSGGGAYGAYEVGVLKALTAGASAATHHTPLSPQIATGTSVGAFNAALLAMYASEGADRVAGLIENVWLKEVAEAPGRGNGVYRIRGNPLRYLDPETFQEPGEPFRSMADAFALTQDWSMRLLRFAAGSGSLAERTSELLDISSFISVEPFAQMLQRTLNLEAIRTSPLSLSIVATQWDTGTTKTFTNQDITGEDGSAVIMASAAIPGIFPPVKVHGQEYVDGGVVLNTPLSTALNMGATELHVIYMSPELRNVPMGGMNATIDTFDRVYHIMLATKISEDIATARWINEGIDVVSRLGGKDGKDSNVTLESERTFLRVASAIHRRMHSDKPYQPVTIHRHYPKKELGDALAVLNFEPARLNEMIAAGEADAREHDCEAAGCVIPQRIARNPRGIFAG